MDIFDSEEFANLYRRRIDQPRILTIERVGSLSRERFLMDHEPSGYPIVFTSSNSRGASSEEQIWDLLAKKHGSISLDVRVGNYASPDEYIKRRETISLSLLDFVRSLGQDSKVNSPYAGNQKPPVSLLQDFEIFAPYFYPSDKFEDPAMWIGGPGSITPLHKDGSDNFAIHIAGAKLWTLFPVRDAPFLYLRRVMLESDFAVSAVDLRAVEDNEFPLFKSAHSINVMVHGGETLYIPEGWGHYVQNISNSFMVNFWIRGRNKSGT